MTDASDIFLRHDLPLAMGFLSVGMFGVWLATLSGVVYQWLGWCVVGLASFGVGAVALGLL